LREKLSIHATVLEWWKTRRGMKCARILVFEDLAFGNVPNILYKDKNIKRFLKKNRQFNFIIF
jgi:hypothetical protein